MKEYILPTLLTSIASVIAMIFLLVAIMSGLGLGLLLFLVLVVLTCFTVTRFKSIVWWFPAPFFVLPPALILLSELDDPHFNHAVFNGPIFMTLLFGLGAGLLGFKARLKSSKNT